MEFTPVDYAAKAITTIIWSDNNSNRIFNIFNPNLISTEHLLKFLDTTDYPIKILEKEDFTNLTQALSKNAESQIKLMGIINDFTDDKDLVYNYTIKQNNDLTCKYLSNLGFEWTIIDDDYIRKILDYMKKVKFIK